MPDLARLRSDLRAFAHAVGFPMTDWQAAAFALQTRTTALVSARQPEARARIRPRILR